jgi:hypothetical protein
MTDNKNDTEGTRVLHVLENLLFLGKSTKHKGKKSASSPDEIKNRVLLKIERAEIMAAMMSMRQDKENSKNSKAPARNTNPTGPKSTLN